MKDENFGGFAKSATDFLGNEWRFDCMGCAIVKGDIKVPGDIIYNGDAVVLAADPVVPVPGFYVINTKRHIRSLSELDSTERQELINLAAYAEKAIKSLGVNEVTLVQEERSSHFHLWIFPNYDWMTEKYGKGITYLRDIFTYAKENAADETKQEVLAAIEKVRTYFNNHNIGE